MTGSGRGQHDFPPERRILRQSEFTAAYSRGKRVNAGVLTATVRVNELGTPRLGLAIAVKAAGNAVQRNRVRRVIRESFRLAQPRLPACDIVVGARPKVGASDNAALRSALDSLWTKVIATCASSSPR